MKISCSGSTRASSNAFRDPSDGVPYSSRQAGSAAPRVFHFKVLICLKTTPSSKFAEWLVGSSRARPRRGGTGLIPYPAAAARNGAGIREALGSARRLFKSSVAPWTSCAKPWCPTAGAALLLISISQMRSTGPAHFRVVLFAVPR